MNFWQSIKRPDYIELVPNYMTLAGTYAVGDKIEQDAIFGVIVDEETVGYASVNQWQAPAPFNARGGYTTVWMHETQRYWTDMTENGAVLLLD